MSETPRQGPRAGRHWPAEDESYDDPSSGARVRRVTSYPGVDDRHLYFTENGWYDDGRRLLFHSDRGRSFDLFSIDLASGLLTQVTDVAGFAGDTTVDHDREIAYFWADGQVLGVDLATFRLTGPIYEVPAGYQPGSMDVNADGSQLYLAISEPVDLDDPDSRFDAVFEAAPETKILSVPIDGGEPTTLRTVGKWANSHVNASPTRPELLSYCEEGPWARVENRIWVLDADSGESWSVRDVPEAGGVGHEYWMADGERLGYHGSLKDPQRREDVPDPEPFIGSARYDDTDRIETEIPPGGTHSHSNSPELLVTDGSPDIGCSLLYRLDEDTGEYEGPRLLATHDWGPDSPHPHSRVLPDDSAVVFDSNRHEGTSDAYLVEIPDFEDLPRYDPE